MNSILIYIARFHDKLFHYWESNRNNRIVGSLLVLLFLGSIVAIQLNRMGLLPAGLQKITSQNFFDAINLVFIALLIYEIFLLIFSLSKSITSSLIKQFELLSLILLRDAFKAFGSFHQPLDWKDDFNEILYMLTDSFGALVIFLLIILIVKQAEHKPFSKTKEDQRRFINIKKAIALTLTGVFIILGIDHMGFFFISQSNSDFFETFYTILIFTDILLVLISLRYSSSYIVVFRNSGFALATVFIRLALVAPPYFNVAIGVLAATFVLGLTYFYNKYRVELSQS